MVGEKVVSEKVEGEQDIFVILKLTAIRGGQIWHSAELNNPGLSKEAYTELEKRISEMLVQLGLDTLATKAPK